MEGEICQTRYCDVGTVIQSKISVDPTRQIEKYDIQDKSIPKGMDPMELRREHTRRRQYNKPIVAQGVDEDDGAMTITVNPTKHVYDYKMQREQAPKKMDELDLRREHINRRQFQKPIVADGHQVGNSHISQMHLQVLLKRLQDEGVQYSNISRYFEDILREASVAREVRAIISDVLVKDREQLRNSDACYQQVIEDLRKRKLHGFEKIEPAVVALSQILLPRGGR